ncbi:hypothetical protein YASMINEVIRUS_133 [Yasminevirus sp. GU-2018]|uniref:Uncharacterized protein n=1 Tax=Yasminevirus sp. GU-2018 TaxID=2420051 RepID=A0A5K0U791_9VIRU|nr:hypothetical protein YASMINEVIRUS_133 [Yasminevirus sp. GU-2018]
MPYVAFDKINDADSYEFDNFGFENTSFQDNCVKELCWVSDEVWSFINKIVNNFISTTGKTKPDTEQKNDDDKHEDYSTESIRVYFTIRMASCRIVNIADDSVRQYLANNTIDFLLMLCRGLTDEDLPFDIEGEKETIQATVDLVSKMMTDHKDEYKYMLKISTIGERLADYLRDLSERLPGGRMSMLGDFSTTWNILTVCETVDKFKTLLSRAHRYGIHTPATFVPSPSEIVEFENELKLMKEYLDNIVASANEGVSKKRCELEMKLEGLKAQLVVTDDEIAKIEAEKNVVREQIRNKREEQKRQLAELEKIEDPTERETKKLEIMNQIKKSEASNTLLPLAKKSAFVGLTSTITIKHDIRSVERELENLNDRYGFGSYEQRDTIKQNIECFFDAFNLKGLTEKSYLKRAESEDEENVEDDSEDDDEFDDVSDASEKTLSTKSISAQKKNLHQLRKRAWDLGSHIKNDQASNAEKEFKEVLDADLV